MNQRIIQYSEWEGTHKLMPPVVVALMFFGLFYFNFILVLPFASLNYAGTVLWFTL